VWRPLAGSREPRVNPSHQLDGIINCIAERVFSCGRWPTIQSCQSPYQNHSGNKIHQFLPALTPAGKRLMVALGPTGPIDAFIYRTGMSDEDAIRVLEKYGIDAYTEADLAKTKGVSLTISL
jgi:hypothetical protein